MPIEHAIRTKKRSVKGWVTSHFASERAALSKIENPVERRCKEIELDQWRDKIEMEILEGAPNVD